ncbi:MAG: GGDEF domain-containing protein [Lachnospiraceae bacterium]|nr:GGDEF domain-containing protein [Lachnospiraceae bacterium]
MVYIVEINVICLFILLFTLSSVCSKAERQVSIRYFTWCVISSLVCITADILFQFLENGSSEALRSVPYLNFAINFIYYVFDVMAGYFWFMYAEYSIDGAVKNSRKLKYLVTLPMFLNTFLCALSFNTGILFVINENGRYERGSLFFVNTFFCYVYVIVASIHALIKSFKTQIYFKKNEYRIIAAYIIFPFALGIIQIVFPDIPTVCLGMAIPILYVHIKLQELQISTDYLTNMNNRNQLIRYLTGKIKNNAPNLYVFMMDVDKFKHINDTYGHTEGDRALISVADKLKEVARQYGGIIARYGGDEFTLATELTDEGMIPKVKETIRIKMEEASENHTFSIRLSVGCAKFEKNQKLVELISRADKALYEEKKARKETEKAPS